MAGNKKINDLAVVSSPVNGALYIIKDATDFQVPAGTANGLATLDATGKLPTSQAPAVTWGTITGTIGDQTDLQAAFVNVTGDDMTGDLSFSGAGRRLKADFSNATQVTRWAFQSTTVNGATGVNAIPNGTATSSQYATFNAADADNSGTFQLGMAATQAVLNSTKYGTGLTRPMSFQFDGVEKLGLSTAGTLAISGGADSRFTASSTGGISTTYASVDGTGAVLGTTSAHPLKFYTSNLERGSVLATGTLSWTSGNVQSLGTTSGFEFQDRTGGVGDNWQWYSSAASARLFWNGTSPGDKIFVGSSGRLTSVERVIGQTGVDVIPPASTEGTNFRWNAVNAGNGASEYINNRGGGGGGHYFYTRVNDAGAPVETMILATSGTLTLPSTGQNFFRADANSATLTRQPRVFVQAGDPGAAAADGDLWFF